MGFHSPVLLLLSQYLEIFSYRYIYLHIQIVNVVPNNFKALVLLVNLNGKPDVSALPDRRQIPLGYVSRVSKCGYQHT
jgi:hypothetical protein